MTISTHIFLNIINEGFYWPFEHIFLNLINNFSWPMRTFLDHLNILASFLYGGILVYYLDFIIIIIKKFNGDISWQFLQTIFFYRKSRRGILVYHLISFSSIISMANSLLLYWFEVLCIGLRHLNSLLN